MPAQPTHQVVRFGPYEANFVEGELRKRGILLKIQAKPLAILQILVSSHGKIVTREELRKTLWQDDVFVDFEKNLATAVNKLRTVLNDSREAPHYIETIPRRGYRFLVPVENGNGKPRDPVLTEKISGNGISGDKILENHAPDASLVSVPLSSWRAFLFGPKRRIWIPVAAGVGLSLFLLAGAFSISGNKTRLQEKDTIVLADFANSTGDPIFDDGLRTALAISLRQSPFLNVLSDNQVASTLKLMTYPADTRLTPDIVRDLCRRTGSKAYVSEAIASLSTEYVLELKAVSCGTGETLAQERAIAASKDGVVDALGSATTKIRGKLGEALATVQSLDVPLEQATTPSLEALKAYTLAQKTAHENGAAQSLPYCHRAIQLDPNFAMAYEAAGVHYFNLAEPARAAEYMTKAFELRENASQRERLKIMASYYSSVTGELDKAGQSYQQMIATYPRDVAAYNNLGIILAEQGQYEKAAEVTRQGIAIAPDEVTLSENLTEYLLALHRFDEARGIIREEQPKKPDNYLFPAASYALAFFSSDLQAMAEQQEWFAGKPEYENFGLALASDTAAFGGRLRKANELTKRAVDSAVRADRKETGAIWEAIGAQREAAYGNPAEGRRFATVALKLAPGSEAVELQTAFAFALAGDTARAKSLARNAGERHPLDTQTQSLWLPVVQAQLELNRKDPASALKTLQPAVPPLEFGVIAFSANASGSCLYPTYLRGEAYLADGNGSAAASEFQKILDRGGIIWNCWTGALAHLGLARANVLQTRSSQGAEADAARVRAMTAYRQFLALWKNADSDIPVLKQAQSEYVQLQ
jgi:DNA-binding winged helix-turn-helix (wHTH) protein/tetratricopeptide (TPR) repeat protein